MVVHRLQAVEAETTGQRHRERVDLVRALEERIQRPRERLWKPRRDRLTRFAGVGPLQHGGGDVTARQQMERSAGSARQRGGRFALEELAETRLRLGTSAAQMVPGEGPRFDRRARELLEHRAVLARPRRDEVDRPTGQRLDADRVGLEVLQELEHRLEKRSLRGTEVRGAEHQDLGVRRLPPSLGRSSEEQHGCEQGPGIHGFSPPVRTARRTSGRCRHEPTNVSTEKVMPSTRRDRPLRPGDAAAFSRFPATGPRPGARVVPGRAR